MRLDAGDDLLRAGGGILFNPFQVRPNQAKISNQPVTAKFNPKAFGRKTVIPIADVLNAVNHTRQKNAATGDLIRQFIVIGICIEMESDVFERDLRRVNA